MRKEKYYALAVQDRVAQVNIFGDITSFPWLDSDVSSYGLVQEIQGLTDIDRIEVHINSYGGEVAEALAIYNVLKRYPAEVDTYVDGFACSAATIIFMAGYKRIMSPLSVFLVHDAWQYVQGNADELRKAADDLDTITEQSIVAYMSGVTKSRDELVELMKEEKFIGPEEAVEWGFATEAETLEDGEVAAQSVKELVSNKLRNPVKEPEPVEPDYKSMASALLAEIKEQAKAEEPEPAAEKPKTLLEKFVNCYTR